MSGHTPGPWHVSLPDETLILGPDRSVVATTLQDDEDYYANFDRRAADAKLIVSSVNSQDQMLYALRDAYTVLAFAFNRIHALPRTRDTELAIDIGKVRGRIEKALAAAGAKP